VRATLRILKNSASRRYRTRRSARDIGPQASGRVSRERRAWVAVPTSCPQHRR
jgi:hypothetical protein